MSVQEAELWQETFQFQWKSELKLVSNKGGWSQPYFQFLLHFLSNTLKIKIFSQIKTFHTNYKVMTKITEVNKKKVGYSSLFRTEASVLEYIKEGSLCLQRDNDGSHFYSYV